MATLTNTKVKDTYATLLKLTSGQIGGGFTVVQDALANDSGLSLSTTGVGVTKLTFINSPASGTTETAALFLNSSDEVIQRDLVASAFTLPSISGSTYIDVTGSYPNFTITNTRPDEIVTFTGDGIAINGTYPNFSLVNTAKDKVVSITGGANLSVTGTYPSFTINHGIQSVATFATDAGTPAQITSTTNMTMTVAGGTGIETRADDTTKTLTIVNTAPDQTVSIAGTNGIAVTGTYPNFTVDGSSVSATGVHEEMFVGVLESPYPLGSGIPQVIAFSNADNTRSDRSYHFGIAPAKLAAPNPEVILNNSGADQILYVDMSAYVQVNGNNKEITYRLQTNTGSGWVTKQEATRSKSEAGIHVDSFWGIFIVANGEQLRIQVESRTGDIEVTPMTQVKFEVKETGNII
jgi:hypothetical protein